MNGTTNEPNEAQHKQIARINDNWPVKRWDVRDDGVVVVTCEDEDVYYVDLDGELSE